MAASAEEWGKEACRKKLKICTHKPQGWKNSEGQSVGENLGCGGIQFLDSFMKQMIDDERDKYGWPKQPKLSRGTCGSSTNAHACGHYTQIIWGSTTEVGCAMSECGSRSMFICHYLGPGNYNQAPYTSVGQCSGGNSGGNTGGSTGGNTGGSTSKCCAKNCYWSPSKATCDSTCENAVKLKDKWCGNNPWDAQCKNAAKGFCKNPPSKPSGGSSGGNNGGNKLCCECKNQPMKAKCSTKCKTELYKKDGWCKNNNWDGQCRNKVKQMCKAASGAFNFDCGHNGSPVCVGSTLWQNDLNATHHFAEDETECLGGKPVYHHTAWNEEHRADILYQLKFDYDDDQYSNKWVLTVTTMQLFGNDTLTEIVAAVCDKTDIKDCIKNEWEIKYEDAQHYIRDYLMPQELEVRDVDCSPVMAAENNASSTPIFIALIAIFVLLMTGVLFYFCIIRKKRTIKKGEKVAGDMMAIRDDDGAHDTKDMVEQIEIEREIEDDAEKDGMIEKTTV